MKKLGVLLAILFCAAPALAQRTVVTGTVTDTKGIPYSGGQLTITLSTPAGTSGAYLQGAQIAGVVGPLSLDVNGGFLANLADNTQIQCATPAGNLAACVPQTQWNFAISESPGVAPPIGTGPQTCPTNLFTISGASQTVSITTCPGLATPVLGTPTFPILAPSSLANNAQYSFSASPGSGLSFNGAGNQLTLNGRTAGFLELAIGPSDLPAFLLNSSTGGITLSDYGGACAGCALTSAAASFQSFAFESIGTTFTASGCGATTLTGGTTAGSYVSVTAGTCTITLTFTQQGALPAHGWVCDAHDQTTTADANNINQTGSTTTTVTFAEGTVAANDVIIFKCIGY